MAKESKDTQPARDSVISIVGPGMRVQGDCETEGTLRIEGTVQGKVQAGKAVVIGRDGVVKGDIITQDAVIGGHVTGKIIAESRLELQETSVVDGEIHARRIKLRQLLLLLAQAGQRSAALAQYDTCRRVLAEAESARSAAAVAETSAMARCSKSKLDSPLTKR